MLHSLPQNSMSKQIFGVWLLDQFSWLFFRYYDVLLCHLSSLPLQLTRPWTVMLGYYCMHNIQSLVICCNVAGRPLFLLTKSLYKMEGGGKDLILLCMQKIRPMSDREMNDLPMRDTLTFPYVA